MLLKVAQHCSSSFTVYKIDSKQRCCTIVAGRTSAMMRDPHVIVKHEWRSTRRKTFDLTNTERVHEVISNISMHEPLTICSFEFLLFL